MKVLVTGATGLAGSHVCLQLRARGDSVRALVRDASVAEPLSAAGVEAVQGDITDAASVRKAAEGCEAAIHSAALLGGASQDAADFEAVNDLGTRHVLDAAEALGLGRVVALSTSTFLDTRGEGPPEQTPIADDPGDDPYTVTKLAAFREVHARAAAGRDVLTCHPGAIYGPGPLARRALHPTSFNRVLLSALQGKIRRYLRFPVTWVFAADVARGAIAALDRGVAGGRYVLDGRPKDVSSTAECCNRICELAGVAQRVEDVTVSEDPALLAEFGPTLVSIARRERGDPSRRAEPTQTQQQLGIDFTPLDEGLAELVGWLRGLGKIGPAH